MNLFDLVSRRDQGVEISAAVTTSIVDRQRAVMLPAGGALTVRNAQDFFVCKTLTDFGWTVKGGPVLVTMKSEAASFQLAHAKHKAEGPLRLDWPTHLSGVAAYDLLIEAEHDSVLFVGPLLDTRALLVPLAKGKGVEIGPGLRPAIKPAADVNVSYVEAQHPEEWKKTYHSGHENPPADILSRYVIGSGATLEMFEHRSLDFIFSAHVLEHMPNPLQVLRNWLHTIRAGGALLAVVPDLRFTFDCRQVPSTLTEMLTEEAAGGHAISREKYDRWCQHTEPRHKPHDLIRRNYSIHVNHLTPEVVVGVAELLVSRGLASRWWMRTAQNNRDFALAIWK